MRLRSPGLLLAALTGAAFFCALPVSADTTCINPGEVPITDATRAVATAADIPTTATCWNPNNPYAGVDTGKVKEELASFRCSGDVNTTQLDPKFATCADAFMKQLRQANPTACIGSAYRTKAQQASACMKICGQLSCPGKCAAPGQSYHQVGAAVDIYKATLPLPQFWQIALQHGIGNPPKLHTSDPYHVQSMNGGQNCSTLGYMPTDDDIFIPGPASNNPYFGYGPNPLPSMQPLSSPVGQPTLPTTPAQNQAQSCNPTYSCSANMMYYQTSTCTTQVYQTCYYGCNVAGSACNTSPSNASSTNATSSSSSVDIGTSTDISNTNTNTNGNGPSTSVSDILNSLVTGHDLFSSTDIGTSAPLTLITATHQIASLQASSTLYPAGTVFASGTITSVQPIGSQSTFTSQDLGTLPSYVPPQNNFALSVLENMKNALLGALNFLRSLVHA